jgi:hypothetical protein
MIRVPEQPPPVNKRFSGRPGSKFPQPDGRHRADMRLFEEKKLSAKSLIKLAFRAGAAFFWALAGGGRVPAPHQPAANLHRWLTSCVLTGGDNVQLSKVRLSRIS